MRTLLLTALLGIFALAASAADVTGKWTAQVPGRGGNTAETTFVFKVDGAKLTGTMEGGRGGPALRIRPAALGSGQQRHAGGSESGGGQDAE